MSFERPPLETLVARTKQDFESRLQTAGSLLRRAVATVFARVLAGAAHLLHGHLEFVGEQVMPDTAIVKYLERWASIWGISRTPAAYAGGSVDMTGTNGGVIPAGTKYSRADGWEYESQAEATIAAGVASVEVEALTAGADGNAEEDVELVLVTPITGVNSSGYVDSDELSGGADEEDDDGLRERVLDRIRRPPMGGAEADYEKWALEVAGVTRVWVYPEYTGPGTVGVTFVRDDDGTGSDIIPDAGEVEDVQDYIDARRPVTAAVTVFAPVADPVALTITVVPNTTAVKAAVENELADMFYRDGEPGGTILLSRIHEAISLAAGESDHTLTVPAANYDAAAGDLPMLGTITWVDP